MKNTIFLVSVVLGLLVLFGLRYQFNVIGNTEFKIIAILMLVTVLIIRSSSKISFFSNN